jgi:beta-lactam-binding protein with PASTA domain
MASKKNIENNSALHRFYRKHLIISHIVLIALVGTFLVMFVMFFLDIWTEHGRTAVVPDVKNMPYESAIGILDDAGLDIEISDSIYDDKTAPGTVVDSWPRANSTVKPGRVVYVTINAFSPKMVTVRAPITGVSSRQSITYLEALGIKNIRIIKRPSEYDDLVEGAMSNGKPIHVGSTIPVTSAIVLEVGTIVKESVGEDEVVGEDGTVEEINDSKSNE